MAPEVVDHILQLFARDRPSSINLCGNGETTMLEGWTGICEPFLVFDNVVIISNLAKVLNWDEVSFLARFDGITTSIDTVDAELFTELRKPAQLRNILLNLNLVRTAAVVHGHPPPSFSISCTVTTKSYWDLTRLVALASTLGIGSVTFSDVFETATAIAHGVRSVATLDSVALTEAATEFQRARTLGEKIGVAVVVSSLRLAALLEGGGATNKAPTQPSPSTVLCLAPWNGFYVNADGRASYCCRHMGATDRDVTSFGSIREILNDTNAVQLREALLSERCPERCRSCELAQPTDPRHLRRAIHMHKIHRIRLRAIARRLPFARTTWRAFRRIIQGK
jgi:hypothetical protein